MPQSVEPIDQQLEELTRQWEADPQDIDLTRRLCMLWDERFKQKRDQESLDGAYYFHHHLNDLYGGANPAVTRKMNDLQRRMLLLHIQSIEDWIAAGGPKHVTAEEANCYQQKLTQLQSDLAKLPPLSKPTVPAANPFLSPPSSREVPPTFPVGFLN